MKKLSGIPVAVALLAAATLVGCPQERPDLGDLHTQNFTETGAAATALAGKQLYFMPVAPTEEQPSFYSRVVTDGVTDFKVIPDGHTPITFGAGDADPFVLNLPIGVSISYYGVDYTRLYIGSDGTIAFEANAEGGSVTNHFKRAQISVLPVDATNSGNVAYRIFSDSIVVTYDNVDNSSFQAELFYSGNLANDLALTYPLVGNGVTGVVGLSNGQLRGAPDEEIEAFLREDFVGTGSTLSENTTGHNTESSKLTF